MPKGDFPPFPKSLAQGKYQHQEKMRWCRCNTTMSPYNSTRKKKPKGDLTRSDGGITIKTNRLLLLACEDRDLVNAKPADVVDSNPIFGAPGTALRIKTRDRVRYFQKIREEEPDLYW
mgnify:CR=1 FL=1